MPASPSVAVVLAVKRLDAAKSRLSAVGPADRRRDLVAAMLADTLAAVQGAGISRVTVVTPDPRVDEIAAAFGARTLAEPPAGSLSPLNAALAHGLAHAHADAHVDTVAALQADLAALDAATLTAALAEADEVLGHDVDATFVADRSGTGTALLVVRSGVVFAPRFGPGSAAAHRTAGAVELDPGRARWARLRTDVDTPDDLAAAARLGLGPRTERAVTSVAPGARSDTNGEFLRS
ncbi:2-phospho-L-lactate guanylyltransferase [Gordonia hydrophobica]|nr:2-phospho-L-lactate guanylyltransferase [Gordonia hydrophobica]